MPSAQFFSVAPVFPVEDVEAAVKWYEAKLGLLPRYVNRDFDDGDPTNYAVLAAGPISLHLLRKAEAGPGFGHKAQALFEVTAGIDELYQSLLRDRAEFLQSLTDQPWGCRDFQVADPDGNKIWISQRLDTERPGE